MPIIKKEVIEAIKDRLNILDIVDEYLTLKKRGKSYIGHCPFHDDRSPSFSITPYKGLYYCFGCQEGGDVIRFYEKYNNVSFKEAVEELAKRLGFKEEDIFENKEESESSKRKKYYKESLLNLMEETCKFFESNLDNKSKEYFINTRKLSEEIIQKYRLGSTPPENTGLTLYLLNKGFSQELIINSGLAIKTKNGELKDFFQNRLIIPINNKFGSVVGFSGRKKSEHQSSKYINSKESPIFQKKKLSFNLDKAKKEIFDKDYVIITEGYFDVIQLTQHGINNAIACMGTNIDPYQIRNLSKLSPNQNIYLLFDNDESGKNAILNLINKINSLIFSNEINLYIIRQNKTTDIDEYLKEGYSFNELIQQATPVIEYLIKLEIIANKDNISKALNNLKQITNRIKDEPLKIEYKKRVAEYYAGEDNYLFRQYLEFLNQSESNKSTKTSNKPKTLDIYSIEIQLLYLTLFTGYKLWICRELLNEENDCKNKLINSLSNEVKNLLMIINDLDTNKYLLYDLRLHLDSKQDIIPTIKQKKEIINFINSNQESLEYLLETPEQNIQDILNILKYKQYKNYLKELKQSLQKESDNDTLDKYIEIKSKLLSQEQKIQKQSELI